jgi:hypothetical protein
MGLGRPIGDKERVLKQASQGAGSAPKGCKAITLGHVKPLLPTGSGMAEWGEQGRGVSQELTCEV